MNKYINIITLKSLLWPISGRWTQIFNYFFCRTQICFVHQKYQAYLHNHSSIFNVHGELICVPAQIRRTRVGVDRSQHTKPEVFKNGISIKIMLFQNMEVRFFKICFTIKLSVRVNTCVFNSRFVSHFSFTSTRFSTR